MLANCHFDSVANSPGAIDEAVGCSVMLEVLHSLVNLSTPLKHGVIFLFNRAEETILQVRRTRGWSRLTPEPQYTRLPQWLVRRFSRADSFLQTQTSASSGTLGIFLELILRS
ncbi:endoplasmic reticulum metallopeptidase 1-like [Sinocyclocheilus grahami]|uniref:endoplasmic reticulum metallopeptidase 1-like n=1 Tax=Sinocyclocheilus grahami TaxID=75366 RepID=UPI0007ACC27E|nr:PREDICTED: endoplasmic reticulum metallopeptidase 1-like [Sinocyclocheilus grahami]